VAVAPPGVPPALHPDQQFVAQPGRGFFAEITEKRIRRRVFKSVQALEQAIMAYLAQHNADPKPCAWVADADAILDRIKRVCERTSDSGH
jgi:hypothetical protein